MVKLPVSQAKRLGFSIKGYVFTKDSKIPVAVIEKAKKPLKTRKKGKRMKYIVTGNVYKIDLKEIR